MKQKLIRLLRCKKGVTYIDMVLLIIVSVMVIVLALNVLRQRTDQQVCWKPCITQSSLAKASRIWTAASSWAMRLL